MYPYPLNYSYLLLTKQQHTFTPEEDIKLETLTNSSQNWHFIAGNFEGKTPRQCKERYMYYISKRPSPNWTPEEEKLLETKFEEIGPHWSKMATFFPNRTDVNLKNHWSAMLNRKSREEVAQKIKAKQQNTDSTILNDQDLNHIKKLKTDMKILKNEKFHHNPSMDLNQCNHIIEENKYSNEQEQDKVIDKSRDDLIIESEQNDSKEIADRIPQEDFPSFSQFDEMIVDEL
ncbi:Myb-like DNA-binding domain containing protein [Tritrichomonas foetus]|uniref:Myb-like DNA-binding domain containing protein n=1 Tax=Tritrichomonas foetus TaxID=1144522 RepID=A0A1J4J1X1_9EUKA|nr:Myb-like DNA-binding domain containing protein [Tritrichomonas foetus]|eukprot:OHS93378.1 Myb-like DNA-binding domain containing protein [Tritrichomonas foetus]